MENSLGKGTGDPLGRPREIRVPAEGVRALGLPDDLDNSPPFGLGDDKSAKGKGTPGKTGPGSGGEGKSGSGKTDVDQEKLGWFDVTVVDAWGTPVGGVDLEFSYQGTRKKLRTPPNGKARVDGVDSSFGSVRFVDVPALREVLRPRWVKKPPETPPDVVNPTEIALAKDMGTISVTSETPMTIVVVKALTRVRLIGMHFDLNKSFLRESAMKGIRKVVEVYQDIPDGHLLIVGHTDRKADEQYNLDLSVERTEAIEAYLKDKVSVWEHWFDDTRPEKKRWGAFEIDHMISVFPCERSVAGFQQFCNDTRGTRLAVDGLPGPATRRALIEAYMSLDGTTLPPSVVTATHGCGEFFPAEATEDGVVDAENRRVEIFCFEDAIEPAVPGKKAKRGEPQYPQWRAQVTRTIDFETADVDGPALVTRYPLDLYEGVATMLRRQNGHVTRSRTQRRYGKRSLPALAPADATRATWR